MAYESALKVSGCPGCGHWGCGRDHVPAASPAAAGGVTDPAADGTNGAGGTHGMGGTGGPDCPVEDGALGSAPVEVVVVHP
ncbi:hypothetical protein [Peterkaempfera sp. SMS 1(5)a]|uniref:hypothetical protein n=1 Tax=Peterkaempfera podocarpi TaxID=3232308 RepID=UPI003672C79E